MSSIRDRIVDDMFAALSVASGKPSSLEVTRHRTAPIARDRLPMQVVYIVDEDVTTGPFSMGTGRRLARRRMTVRVESRVDAGGNLTPDEALDPLLTWAVQQISADPTRGGLALDTTESKGQWTADEKDTVYAANATDFTVDYITSASDPTAAT